MWLINALKTCWQTVSEWFVILKELIEKYGIFVLIFSVASLVLSIAGCAALITFLPQDYFIRANQGQQIKNPILRFFVTLLKNLVGGVLIVAGALMTVLPGQGLLTILAGLVISDFPGKKRLARRIIRIPAVFLAANKIRTNFDRPPLQLNED